MVGRWPVAVLLSAFVIAAVESAFIPGASAQATRPVNESFFVERVYPLLHAVQCERCHSDNGVASETRLEFPESDASRDQLTAFGLSLLDLVDRRNPEQSLLLRKPTKRAKHTGGQRIKPGSDEEAVVLTWINYLSGLSDNQVRQAREQIARSDQHGLEALAVRRLTHSEYNNTVADLLGDQIQPANSFPNEDFVKGFKNQSEAQGVSPIQAEAYSKAAERLARAAFRGGDQHGLIPRPPESPTDAVSIGEFIRKFGLKAFRRPLTDSEVRRYSALFLDEARRAHSFQAGATMVIEAILQSPNFLFRIERGSDSHDAQFAIASRLSYFIWSSMPDEPLLQLAEQGKLADPAVIEQEPMALANQVRQRAVGGGNAAWSALEVADGNHQAAAGL